MDWDGSQVVLVALEKWKKLKKIYSSSNAQFNRQLFHVNGSKGNLRFSGAAGGPICCAEMECDEMQ